MSDEMPSRFPNQTKPIPIYPEHKWDYWQMQARSGIDSDRERAVGLAQSALEELFGHLGLKLEGKGISFRLCLELSTRHHIPLPDGLSDAITHRNRLSHTVEFEAVEGRKAIDQFLAERDVVIFRVTYFEFVKRFVEERLPSVDQVGEPITATQYSIYDPDPVIRWVARAAHIGDHANDTSRSVYMNYDGAMLVLGPGELAADYPVYLRHPVAVRRHLLLGYKIGTYSTTQNSIEISWGDLSGGLQSHRHIFERLNAFKFKVDKTVYLRISRVPSTDSLRGCWISMPDSNGRIVDFKDEPCLSHCLVLKPSGAFSLTGSQLDVRGEFRLGPENEIHFSSDERGAESHCLFLTQWAGKTQFELLVGYGRYRKARVGTLDEEVCGSHLALNELDDVPIPATGKDRAPVPQGSHQPLSDEASTLPLERAEAEGSSSSALRLVFWAACCGIGALLVAPVFGGACSIGPLLAAIALLVASAHAAVCVTSELPDSER